MTKYEAELVVHLARELDPKHRVGSLSLKTCELSEECKEQIRALMGRRGYRVEFPAEPAFGGDPATLQHFIRAFALKLG